MHDFREIGQRLSNWGRWGDDEKGTGNLITGNLTPLPTIEHGA